MTRHWLPIFIRRRRHYRASFDVALCREHRKSNQSTSKTKNGSLYLEGDVKLVQAPAASR